jgi:hypothetical protein
MHIPKTTARNLRSGPNRLLMTAAVLLFLAAPRANAGMIPFFLTDFSLVNSNADGTWATPDSGRTLVLTGGNNGSGLFGTTDFFVMALVPVTFQFDYSYASADAPGYDRAGYFIGLVFTALADTSGESGSASVSVDAGDQFGFRIETDDNTGEPGVFTVSPFATSAVPEPANLYLILGAILGGAAFGWSQNRRRRQGDLK